MIFTFYSYKGGVGRSMALANIAELFYRSGQRVLMVDWDLEAPGLERYFFDEPEPILENLGLIDMLLDYKAKMAQNLPEEAPLELDNVDKYIIDVYPKSSRDGRLFLLIAGRRSDDYLTDYARTVLSFDWQDFYDNWEGEIYFEWLRDQFESLADVILIDSRTGVTEISGICTYQMANVVLMFCAANWQSLNGTRSMAQNLRDPRVMKLRGGRPLHILVVPARVEHTESTQLDKFKLDFIRLFRDLAPRDRGISVHQLWDLGIPYVPKYAFLEVVAVREGDPRREKPASAEKMVEAFRGLGEVMRKVVRGVGIEVPKGVVPLDSPFYVRRDADKNLELQLERSGTITSVRGARQTGKTSLLVRGVDCAERRGATVVHIDFQEAFGSEQLENSDSFLKALANLIAFKLNLDFSGVESMWKSPLSPQIKMTRFVEESLLQRIMEPTVLAFDEADTLLGTGFYGEFFGMLRAWHNRRAGSELWGRLNIIIATSTNPTLLIDNIHQSPFNVGLTIELTDFSQDQILDLNQRFGNPMTREEVSKAMKLLGGHPYLIRQAFYTLVSEGLSWAELAEIADRHDGPFGDHLKMYWNILKKDSKLMEAIRGVVLDHICPDEKTLLRLSSAGLVAERERECVCRYGLYERFFRSQLS